MDRKHGGRLAAARPGVAAARIAAVVALTGIAVVAGLAAASVKKGDGDTVMLRAQLGIIYAQQGNREGARQEFVKLLEVPAGRAAALVNLGNLAFLDGEVEEAVASYDQAAALDGEDAGILLNRGLALKLLGRTEEAEKSFAAAVEMAGGVEKASFLLGLHSAEDTGRGRVSKMTADELRQMLLKAKAKVPETQTASNQPEKRPQVASRPGGVRAAEAVGEQNLYWKER